MVAFLITNGARHSAFKWAEISANEIAGLIHLEASVSQEVAEAKSRFTLHLRHALEPKFDACINQEIAAVAAAGDASLGLPYALQTGDAALTVSACAIGTPFETHFALPAVQAVVSSIIGNHFASIAHIERSNYVDAAVRSGPPSAAVQEFVARHRT